MTTRQVLQLITFILYIKSCDCTCGSLFGFTKICNNPCGAYKYQDMSTCECLNCPSNSGSTCYECCSVTSCACNPNFTSTSGTFPCTAMITSGNKTITSTPVGNGSVAQITTSMQMYLTLLIINFLFMTIY
jgi:hypothetical protein